MSEENNHNENLLAKTFDAQAIEPKIVEMWDKANAFAAGAGRREGEDSFTIVIPPPNVTGSLHIGHAFNNTLQDILIRYQRMKGKDVLWQPGMDHAGIATQGVVERQLAERNEPSRKELGREKFIERIWEWKEESGGLIFNQLKRLGASCDWSRERFTMDEGLSAAVLKVFVSLYKEGLIYKDKRLVNWDPKLLTAISDLEVEQIETKGHLWHFRYPLEDGVTYQHPYVEDEEGNRSDWKPSMDEPSGYEERDYLIVATTRPETMLGDTGVAVHPDDPRYKDLIGKNVVLPLVGRKMPIVADHYPDPEEGTGAVKMTPAHDFNDFEVGNRCDLRQINVLTVDGKIFIKENSDFLEGLESNSQLVESISQLEGQDRFKARDLIIQMMDDKGLLAKTEPHKHMVPHGDRGGVPIEPFLTDQWYVNAEELAKPAIASVREGRTNFVPKNWENTYFNWMENIQPWCISRQLWWGHRIPAWYGPDDHVFVEQTEEEAIEAAKQHYGKEVELTRDPDVLDTWFSSGLWPFSTLGWPDETPELKRYYQTDVLITGFDIIFFWVARMMMTALHFMKDEDGTPIEPFHTVYVHALVRDKHGAKMSKSKGNVVDPLEMIDEFGADALRFTLASMAIQGGEVKLDPARVANYRNFGTKLWNATRFALMNGVRTDAGFEPEKVNHTINRWILAELSKTAAEVTEKLDNYRFNEAANAAYRFTWNNFCDWYLELLKPVFSGDDEAVKAESQACAAYVLASIYKLLHPFMPFITEELWQRTSERDELLCHAQWPAATQGDEEAAQEINWLIKLVTEIRSVRSEMGIKPSQMMELLISGADDQIANRASIHSAAIGRLARIEEVRLVDTAPKGCAQITIDECNYLLPLEGIVDFAEERARLEKELKKLDGEITRLDKKLSNERFVANAPADIVAEEREKLAGYQSQQGKMAAALERISA